MRVQQISGKDVQARSLTLLRSKLSRSRQANPGFEGGQGQALGAFRAKKRQLEKVGGAGGVQGVQRCLGNCMASLLRSNIQDFDFVQEVPLGQMAQGTPFSVACRGHPPPFLNVGRERGRSNLPNVQRRIPQERCW